MGQTSRDGVFDGGAGPVIDSNHVHVHDVFVGAVSESDNWVCGCVALPSQLRHR